MSTIYCTLLILYLPASTPLTLEDVIARASDTHPALQAAALAVEEETYEAVQSGVLPNPEIEVGIEGWKPNNSDTEEATFLFGVSQTLPISGTRRWAKKSGMIGAEAAAEEAEGIRLAVEGYAGTLFYHVLAAQERTKILEDIFCGAKALTDLTRIRFEQGDLPEIDLMRITVEKDRYETNLESTRKEKDALRAQLAELCGFEESDLPECIGEIVPPAEMLPDTQTIRIQLASSPLSTARSLRVEQAETAIKSVRRSVLSEPTLYAGFRRNRGADSTAVDLGLRIALPLFDRKQGAIAAAQVREQRIQAENEGIARSDLRTCMALHAEVEAAITTAEKLRNVVIPQLSNVGAIVEKAQQIGGSTVFEALIARRDIAETRLALLENESTARTALIELQVMLGQ